MHCLHIEVKNCFWDSFLLNPKHHNKFMESVRIRQSIDMKLYVNYFAFPHFVNFEVLRLLCAFFFIFE